MSSLLLATTLLGSLAAAVPTHPHGHGSAGGYSSGAPTVSVKNGTVAGLHSTTYNQDLFLGVPFAQPPVGELRFRNPQSINTTFNGTIQATEYAPECVGYGGDQIGYPVSEDCLYLNVIRPSGYEHESLPVGVWIHGGGLFEGGTRDERYNLSFIVDNSVAIGKPIIAVSIAYRLNAWGFLNSLEVTGSGQTNVGLRDQRLALHWVQENLASFGGDPSKVTIWGESAGAGSVGWHIMAYNGRDDNLFRAGIMESGNPVAYSSYRDDITYQPLYDGLVANASCQNATDTLDCLRHVPFETLNDLLNTTYSTDWQPIVDGDFIQRFGSQQLAEGNFVKVPIIDGANTDEGTAFGPSGINSTQDFIDHIVSNASNAYIGDQFVPSLLDAYPDVCSDYIPPQEEVPCNVTIPGEGEEYRRSAAYFGDVVMIANRRGACQAWAANGLEAYCYRFNTIPNGIPWNVGVTHFQEVAFVFDNVNGLGYDAEHGTVNPFGGKPESYTQLAKLMSNSWASFIHDLNPNNFTGRHSGTPEWPVYSVSEPQNIVWDANSTELAYPEADTWRQSGIQWILDHALAYHR